jgi:hypothetical protein
MNVPGFDSHAKRQAWAFAAIVGGCVVFTMFAAVGVYLVRGNALFAFYLALAAHVQVLVGMTCIGALLVKRRIKVDKDGVELSDDGVNQ